MASYIVVTLLSLEMIGKAAMCCLGEGASRLRLWSAKSGVYPIGRSCHSIVLHSTAPPGSQQNGTKKVVAVAGGYGHSMANTGM